MATFTNNHDAKLVLMPTFVLSPGQSREATAEDAAQMNKPVVGAWLEAEMLTVEGEMPVADAKAAQDAADAKKAADKKSGKGSMPGVSK